MIVKTDSAFAVIADIHGNADALRAVLADIETRNLSSIVNLGDLLSGPLAAKETAEILMESNILSIRGNHDRWLVEKIPAELGASDQLARSELDSRHLDWLRSLPATLYLTPDIFLCHGTPSSDTNYWLERVNAAGEVNLRPRQEIESDAQGVDAGLILCGHTHIPRRVDLSGGRVILNPGSVGCPGYDDDFPVYHVMEAGTAAACYAIVENTHEGWRSSMHHVPYDASRMVALARKAGRTEWANALETGWVR